MRKINSVLSIAVLALFILHMAVGSLLMAGILPYIAFLLHTLSGTLILVAAAHTAVGAKLTCDTFAALKKSGASYIGDNLPFWIRRVSGLAVMLFVILHTAIFTDETGEPGRFDALRLICSILLVLSVLLHIVTNIRPLMAGLGKRSFGKAVTIPALTLSLLLLAAGAAFIVYFIKMSL